MNEHEALAQLAADCGVLPAYHDIDGREHYASDATRQALLAAMGVTVGDDAAVREALQDWNARHIRCALPPAVVIRVGQPRQVRVHLAERFTETKVVWQIAREDGALMTGNLLADSTVAERIGHGDEALQVRVLALPALPHGYHSLALSADAQSIGETRLIVAPASCYWPAAIDDGKRIWGPVVQLYSVRSRRNWGIGDFTDLATIVDQWGSRGADIVGLNPLHALFFDNPAHASPYSPSSRLFLNTLYLDCEAVPDFAECEAARALVASHDFQQRLAHLRSVDLVDYPGVAQAKYEVLELLYPSFRAGHLAADSERATAFRAFQRDEGRALRLQALYDALQEHFHRADSAVRGWHHWPEAYRHPANPAVARFEGEHPERIEFFEYLQWNAVLQLAAARQRARELRMGVGLYADLAVSVDPGGANVWSERDGFALEASVGCPPDPFGPAGQDWGLPPLIPHRLADAAYEPFVRLLRENMAHAGALRLDHVMGLRRLFWIPRDRKAAEGAYVSYPFDDLLGILALESHRNRCLVVGEDLGTVPDEVRAAMARERILSYRLLFFEREHGGAFKAPQHYGSRALVAVATHDLATLAGFWTGRDLALRSELGFFANTEQRDGAVRERAQERHHLLAALEREGLSPGPIDASSGASMPPGLADAVHAFLARTPCEVMVVQLDDLGGVDTPTNIPGTTNEYPNWRRKLPVDLEDLPGSEGFELLTARLREIRGPRSSDSQT